MVGVALAFHCFISDFIIHRQPLTEIMDFSLFEKIDEPIKVNEPTLIPLVQKKQIEPCDDMVDLLEKVFHPFFPFEVGMEKRKEMKIAHALQRRNGILFVKDEDELGEDPAS